MHLDNDKLKQTAFLFTLIALGVFIAWQLHAFISPFLGALIFYILLRQPLVFLTERLKKPLPKPLAVSVLILASFVVMVLPVLLVSLMLSSKLNFLIVHYTDVLHVLDAWSKQLSEVTGFELLSESNLAKVAGLAANILPAFVSATASVLADIFVLYFVLFFLLYNSAPLENFVRQNLPFNNGNNRLLLNELKQQTYANTLGMVVLAILQGVAAFIGYWLIGVKEPFFWAVITGIMSFLPVVGTVIVWAPLTIFTYTTGTPLQGIGLALYGGIVITNIDNLFRFVIQKKLGDTHPLITFFGVILGIDLFGFVGIIFGPLLISYFILLLKIYRNEYMGKPH